MITRVYIHNFRSFVNFEAKFGSMHVLLGPNGAGKSALLDVVARTRALLTRSERIEAAFPPHVRTRGVAGADGPLRIELDVEGNGGSYRYRLEIEYAENGSQQRVHTEELSFNGGPLYRCMLGEARLFRDDHSEGPAFPMDWSQSGVGFLHARPDNTLLTWFKRRLANVFILRINPFVIREESRAETPHPADDLADFADWYRYLLQAQPERAMAALEELRERIPGFRSLRFEEAGDGKILMADFDAETDAKKVSFRLGSLSDGQKVLIALYVSLRARSADDGYTLCVDEPENFLALPEVQPWIDSFNDLTETDGVQGILVSHHPRVINFLADDCGLWLERPGGTGPTRIERVATNGQSPLNVDELIERGWIHG